MKPPYSSLPIANTFLDLAGGKGVSLTATQIHKLIYLAHGWHLALFDEPLINHSVEAWRSGPVIPPLYYKTRRYGAGPITQRIPIQNAGLFIEDGYEMVPEQDVRTRAFMERIWNVYGCYSVAELAALTREDGTPWYVTWHLKGGRLGGGADIEPELVKEHFVQLRVQREQ